MRYRLCGLRRVGGVIVTVAVLALMCGAADVAGAAQQPSGQAATRSQPVVNSWALAPTGADKSQPGSRSFFSYDLAAGSVIRDSATLWNFSNVPVSFKVYPTDAFNDATGALNLLPGDRPPTDAGSWITLTYTEVTLQPRKKVDIPFTVAIPPNARPGDHVAALLAANEVQGTGPDGKVVNLDRRTGSRAYVRVKGPLSTALVIENVRTAYHPALNPLGGSLDVTYTVRNAGNVRLGAHQEIVAMGPLGLAAAHGRPKDIADLLPGAHVTLHSHFTSIAALVRDAAEIRLRPFSPDPDVTALRPMRRAGHTWAVPWSVLAAALILWLGRRSYRVIRRQRRHVAARSVPAAEEQLSLVP